MTRGDCIAWCSYAWLAHLITTQANFRKQSHHVSRLVVRTVVFQFLNAYEQQPRQRQEPPQPLRRRALVVRSGPAAVQRPSPCVVHTLVP